MKCTLIANMNKEILVKCVKYFLIVINLIFVVIGAFAFGFGIVTLIVKAGNFSTYDIGYLSGAITGGIFLSSVSIVGYLGARKENVKLLKVYAWILLVLVLIKIGYVVITAIISHGQKSGVPDVSEFKVLFDRYGLDDQSKASVDELQRTFYCCGYDGPQSMQNDDGTYPRSCCLLNEVTCRVPFLNGCELEISRANSVAFTTAKVIFYIFPLVQILCIVQAFTLAAFIKIRKFQHLKNDNF